MAADRHRALWTGHHVEVIDCEGHEVVRRVRATGVVAIVATTTADELVLVEQYRRALGTTVVELAAGLAGDLPDAPDEALLDAAKRELLEETGFVSDAWTLIHAGPTSAGLTDEVVHLYRARDARRVGPGGGDASEAITVHVVPTAQADAWLADAQARGAAVDHKVLTGLAVARAGRD